MYVCMYGLPEYENENNYDLYDSVNKVFAEIMAIDTNPYIEEMKRIGKKGGRRPIEIEFISRRFARYIMENSKYFRNSGLAISTFMTGEKLRERNMLKQKLQEARQKGHYAIIRNNRLFINGKPYEDIQSKSQRINSENDIHPTTKQPIQLIDNIQTTDTPEHQNQTFR
jgi:hypothetical protein